MHHTSKNLGLADWKDVLNSQIQKIPVVLKKEDEHNICSLAFSTFSSNMRKTFKNPSPFLLLMAQDKISMPSSGAGITRYFDDFKSKVEIQPQHVIIMVIVVIAIIIFLQFRLAGG